MIRIDVSTWNAEEIVLKLSGKVTLVTAEILEMEINPWRRQPRRLVLDLKEVRSVDGMGLALLGYWGWSGVVLRNARRYVQMGLEQYGVACKPALPLGAAL